MTDTDVDRFLNALDHPHKPAILALREAILTADPGISDTVKWNAPDFCYAGEDRVTMRLAPRGAFQLILHRGSRVRGDLEDFSFPDPTGLISWAAPDRGVIDLGDAGILAHHLEDILTLVRRWVQT